MSPIPHPLIATGRTAEIFAWEDGSVLKLFLDWCPRDFVQSEARKARIIHASGLAIPAVLDTLELDGRHGIVYERIDGPTLLDRIQSAPFNFRPIAEMMAALHSEIHDQSVSELPSQHERLAAKIQAVEGAPEEVKQAALARLQTLPEGDKLLHGDFHPGNVMASESGAVIIDWPDASRGHPMADVARTRLLLQVGRPPGFLIGLLVNLLRRRFLQVYEKAYFQRSTLDPSELQSWMLPVAFGRLSEGIEAERDQLIEIIKRQLPGVL